MQDFDGNIIEDSVSGIMGFGWPSLALEGGDRFQGC
jgi:hypothetical protein